MNSFYRLMEFIKERKIRKGDILVVKPKKDLDDKELWDYYNVTKKDFVSQVNGTYLFDNYYFFDLLENFVFDVKFSTKK